MRAAVMLGWRIVVFWREIGGNPNFIDRVKGIKPLKILKTLMTSACLLSTIFALAGCGHLINRLI
ncbi:hypothetical protein OOJ09_07035 [Mesorhizobium qingshengii]|uniref:Uncharacterized protein n=1 Tax=Mesorhizobium qingshengii TaxID=1165689 RepID=A0ABT4QQS4_9HYPH|nr:hypothetical protein [Mesorhizobium qingshengii]MCZ8543926.1 hypothetical protein [Mesorhizobium qingshengii]